MFAAKGYAEAAISDIADEADVAVTAVYYHFTGKDDLFAAAMRETLRSMSDVVVAARPRNGAADSTGLSKAIDAVWEWNDQNPQRATLVHIQLPGATRQMTAIRQEFLDLHERRAEDYVLEHASQGRQGIGALTMRTLIDASLSVHAMRMEDGPLSKLAPDAVRAELQRIANRLLVS